MDKKFMIDITGNKYSRLTVINISHQNKQGKYYWNCVCSCGNTTCVNKNDLTAGKISSCGCLRYERWKASMRKLITHGHTRNSRPSKTYTSWVDMKQRCYNPKNDGYVRYGERNISIFTPWKESFARFLKDNGIRPKGKTLDRIDNNKGYFPGNVRWATAKQQANNRG